MPKKYYRKRKASYDQIFLALGVLAALLAATKALTVSPTLIGWSLTVLIMVGLLVVAAVFTMVLVQRQNRQRRVRIIRLEHIDTMTGIAFERYVGQLLEFQGYKVSYTKVTGDFGVDIIAKRLGERYAVQTKRVSSILNQEPIREVVAGMKRHNCTQSMVVTNRSFNQFAKTLARSNDCTLVDRSELAKWIQRFKTASARYS